MIWRGQKMALRVLISIAHCPLSRVEFSGAEPKVHSDLTNAPRKAKAARQMLSA
jgi:hypothetical protein